jgi:hypothetical protein
MVGAKRDASQMFKNRVIKEAPWNTVEDSYSIWTEMSTHIRKVAIYVFEVTRENKHKTKGTW